MEICSIVDRKTGISVCPLKSVEAGASIGDELAQVTIVQNYINTSTVSIEALYTFPLPHKAQVNSLKVRLGDSEIYGEIMEKAKAFREYDAAVRSGDSAFLLESHRPDIFQVSLGNIAPGEEISITISYLQEIEVTDKVLRWILPTVVAPRYIPGDVMGRRIGPGTAYPTDRVPDADYITPSAGQAVYTLKLEAKLYMASKINSISSPSHPVTVVQGAGFTGVTLSREDELLDRDFILAVELEDDTESRLGISESEDGETFGHLRFVPQIDMNLSEQCKYEYIFLLDISGSMAGRKLEQAKRALGIALRNLMEGDYFNVLAFETNFRSFSEYSVPYSQENLERADDWIGHLYSSGGTEIYKPLSFVLSQIKPVQDTSRIVLLFTDGQVGNENEVISLVKAYGNSMRLFPFGIDTSVNRYFIDSLAEAGNGMPEYIYPGEHIEDKVIRQFSRINEPCVINPQIKSKEGIELDIVPNVPKRLYASDIYNFAIKCTGPERVDVLVIKGETAGEEYTQKIMAEDAGDRRLNSLKWAKGKIKTLEEMMNGNNGRRNEIIREEILDISKRYGVMSTLSSFTAVYKRTSRMNGLPETVVVPVSEPYGWKMFNHAPDRKVMYAAPVSPRISACTAMPDFDNNAYEIPSFLRRGSSSHANLCDNRVIREEPSALNSMINKIYLYDDELNEAIRTAAGVQKADGSFGTGSDANRKTSLFIIGMLLMRDEWKPYRIQVRKAGEALVKSDDAHALCKGLALRFILKLRVSSRKKAVNALEKIERALTEYERNIYNEAEAGKLDKFLEHILRGDLINKDKAEVSAKLLGMVL